MVSRSRKRKLAANAEKWADLHDWAMQICNTSICPPTCLINHSCDILDKATEIATERGWIDAKF